MGAILALAARRSNALPRRHIQSVAVAHGTALLADIDSVVVVEADLRDVPLVLATPAVRRLFDFSRPIGVELRRRAREEAVEFLITPYEQPPGGPFGLWIGTGDTHAHPPGSRR